MQATRDKATWISEATWRLVDNKKKTRRRHMMGQLELRAATRVFQASLQEDRIWRVSTVGEGIEALVVEYHMREYCRKIQR